MPTVHNLTSYKVHRVQKSPKVSFSTIMQTKRATLSFNSVHLNFRAKKFMGTPTVLQLLTGFGLEEDGVKI